MGEPFDFNIEFSRDFSKRLNIGEKIIMESLLRKLKATEMTRHNGRRKIRITVLGTEMTLIVDFNANMRSIVVVAAEA